MKSIYITESFIVYISYCPGVIFPATQDQTDIDNAKPHQTVSTYKTLPNKLRPNHDLRPYKLLKLCYIQLNFRSGGSGRPKESELMVKNPVIDILACSFQDL